MQVQRLSAETEGALLTEKNKNIFLDAIRKKWYTKPQVFESIGLLNGQVLARYNKETLGRIYDDINRRKLEAWSFKKLNERPAIVTIEELLTEYELEVKNRLQGTTMIERLGSIIASCLAEMENQLSKGRESSASIVSDMTSVLTHFDVDSLQLIAIQFNKNAALSEIINALVQRKARGAFTMSRNLFDQFCREFSKSDKLGERLFNMKPAFFQFHVFLRDTESLYETYKTFTDSRDLLSKYYAIKTESQQVQEENPAAFEKRVLNDKEFWCKFTSDYAVQCLRLVNEKSGLFNRFTQAEMREQFKLIMDFLDGDALLALMLTSSEVKFMIEQMESRDKIVVKVMSTLLKRFLFHAALMGMEVSIFLSRKDDTYSTITITPKNAMSASRQRLVSFSIKKVMNESTNPTQNDTGTVTEKVCYNDQLELLSSVMDTDLLPFIKSAIGDDDIKSSTMTVIPDDRLSFQKLERLSLDNRLVRSICLLDLYSMQEFILQFSDPNSASGYAFSKWKIFNLSQLATETKRIQLFSFLSRFNVSDVSGGKEFLDDSPYAIRRQVVYDDAVSRSEAYFKSEEVAIVPEIRPLCFQSPYVASNKNGVQLGITVCWAAYHARMNIK